MRQIQLQVMALFLAAAFVASSGLQAQEIKVPVADEVKAEVPALTKFHDVVYKIWHTAWPEKNAVMLRELEPEVVQLSADLFKAELPGILREKKTLWNENVDKLKIIVADYKTAAQGKDDQKMLNVAEQLHTQYEKLVRIIRPALKELDAFHAVLYPLYHYYMPEFNLEKIKGSVAELRTSMATLNKAVLPDRLKEKEKAFAAARSKLSESVKLLDSSLKSNDKKTINEKVDVLHSRYEELNKIFE
jgi:hypothetical protein